MAKVTTNLSTSSGTSTLLHNNLVGLNEGDFVHLTAAEKLRLGILESTVNKQNTLTHDGTGIRYPTVDAVNNALVVIKESIETSKDKHYTHNQVGTSTIWIVTHNLKKHPSVSVIDSGNNVVIGDCNYDSENQLTLTFSSSFSGKAYLN